MLVESGLFSEYFAVWADMLVYLNSLGDRFLNAL